MMDKSFIEQVRHANDIVDVVSSYIPLKRVGSNHRGLCPFHKDSNPSLYVSEPKQIYKCFACGASGNVFGFVEAFEKLSFIEAVKKLAGRAGISIPQLERTKTVSTKREQLLAVYRSAKDFFSNNLHKHGASVLDYLKNRSLSPETAKSLELGYALNSEKSLLNHLLKEGYGVSLLKESGLFGVYQGNLTDMFRERLIFPIHNSTGEVVAFGGRILDGSSPSKYMNSPGTELYTKGNQLYGLFKTRYDIGQQKSALVSEGYFDFLRLYESGFTNSVASLGTALTDEQIYLLMRYCKHIKMLYDGDPAGVKAAVRGGLLCLARGLQVSVVKLPQGADPDSFILDNGKDAMQALIDQAEPLIEYMAHSDRIENPLPERIDQLLDAVRAVKDPIQREFLIKDIAEAFGISEKALNSKLSRSVSREIEPEKSPVAINQGDFSEERMLLALSLKDRDSYNLLANELSEAYFNNKLLKSVFRYLIERVKPEDLDEPSSILDYIESKEIKESLAELLFEDLHDMRFEDALTQVKIRKLQRDISDMDRMIEKDPQNLELLKQKRTLTQLYRRMTKKVVNKVLFQSGHI